MKNKLKELMKNKNSNNKLFDILTTSEASSIIGGCDKLRYCQVFTGTCANLQQCGSFTAPIGGNG